jgi:hypothetical protein
MLERAARPMTSCDQAAWDETATSFRARARSLVRARRAFPHGALATMDWIRVRDKTPACIATRSVGYSPWPWPAAARRSRRRRKAPRPRNRRGGRLSARRSRRRSARHRMEASWVISATAPRTALIMFARAESRRWVTSRRPKAGRLPSKAPSVALDDHAPHAPRWSPKAARGRCRERPQDELAARLRGPRSARRDQGEARPPSISPSARAIHPDCGPRAVTVEGTGPCASTAEPV